MAKADGSLGGRTALVTGAGRGIGRAIALALADAGARVGALARSRAELDATVRLIKAAGGRARAVSADVTSERALDRAICDVEAKLGPVDILVNNAGVVGPIAPFAETDPNAWWRSVEVNLQGPMLAVRRILPGMIARGDGRIVNLVTGVAPFAYFSGYCAGKAALVRFSECLAAETREQGVAVFAMGPGTVRTAMSEHSLNSDEGKKWLPWFRRIFDEGLDFPPERPAALAVSLASGRYDALTGLTLTPRDDLDAILARLEEVERDKLYSMRLRTLPNPDADRIEAVRESGTRPLAAVAPLVVERRLGAPRERVFAAWTEPMAVAEWFLPPAGAEWIDPPIYEARSGGRIRLAVRSEGKDFRLHGSFIALDPPARLELTWGWGADFPYGDPGETRAVIELRAERGATWLVLTQTGFLDEVPKSAHERGWNRCLDAMERLLARGFDAK